MKKLDIDYTVQIWKEGDQYVAHATPIDVMSSGRTVEEAREALDEAVLLFIKTASDAGTLDAVLKESGYSKRRSRWIKPEWIGVEQHSRVVGL
jgi:predicted RNase H-like HicB family nuclease